MDDLLAHHRRWSMTHWNPADIAMLRRDVVEALQDIADKAEVYLEEGTNPRRNQLDEAVLKLRRLQGERQAE